MTAATAVTATFTQANVLSVAISGNGAVTGGSGAINCGGGASICSANFAAGATVSLVATPATRRHLHRLDRRLRRQRDHLHRVDDPVEERNRHLQRRHDGRRASP